MRSVHDSCLTQCSSQKAKGRGANNELLGVKKRRKVEGRGAALHGYLKACRKSPHKWTVCIFCLNDNVQTIKFPRSRLKHTQKIR
jgi:hypothetical protein